MKRYIYGCMGLLLLLAACDSDETLHPTDKNVNWFVVQDDPQDELKHLIFQVYESTGIPIFCEDTIGVEDRGVDPYGNPVIHHENLNVFYGIDKSERETSFYVETRNKADLIEGVKFIRDHVIPHLPSRLMPMSYFLVEELSTETRWEVPVYADCYDGMRTTVVSRVSSLANMEDTKRRMLGAEIAGIDFCGYLLKNNMEDLNPFYEVTNSVYGENIYNKSLGSWTTPSSKTPTGDYGVIDWSDTRTPTQKQDVAIFSKRVLMNEKDKFMTEFAVYPHVKKKYEIMEKLMEKVREAVK